MTIPRNRQICLEQTPYYHCVSRCVRRAFLCGLDRYSGKSFEHRRGWVENRLIRLSKAFCIDIVSYAILSNHYHVILKVNRDQAQNLSDHDVIYRWGLIYSINPLVNRFIMEEPLTRPERIQVISCITLWRKNLTNISKYMGHLNERIARQANQEDHCKGRFWEGRFTSQALLDDNALLQCMTYVDLNPVRAGISATPEQSEYTSLSRRLKKDDHGLLAFSCKFELSAVKETNAIPYHFVDYLELVDWTGRMLREDKRGVISASYPCLLNRIKKNPSQWIRAQKHKPGWTPKAMGSATRIKAWCQANGQNWLWQTPTFDSS